MDWGSNYDARIDRKNKKVTLRVSGEAEVEFRGQRHTKKILLIIQARRMLRQGCEAYLAHVVDINKKNLG